MQIVLIILFLLITNVSNAYIGPGMAAGTMASVIGFIVAIIVLIISLVYYPFKILLKKLKNKKKKEE